MITCIYDYFFKKKCIKCMKLNVITSPLPRFPPLVVIMDPLFDSPSSTSFTITPPPGTLSSCASSAQNTIMLSPSFIEQPRSLRHFQSSIGSLHLNIPLCRDTHACTKHPIYHIISCDCLPPSFCAFALLVAFEFIL